MITKFLIGVLAAITAIAFVFLVIGIGRLGIAIFENYGLLAGIIYICCVGGIFSLLFDIEVEVIKK